LKCLSGSELIPPPPYYLADFHGARKVLSQTSTITMPRTSEEAHVISLRLENGFADALRGTWAVQEMMKRQGR